MFAIKKFLVLLLLLSMAVPAAVSCSESPAITETSDTTAGNTVAVPEEELTDLEKRQRIPDELPVKDFGGRSFRVACEEAKSYEVYSEELDGEVTNDVVFERNSAIQDRFNTVIENIVVVDAHDHLVRTVTAADDAYELSGYKAYLSYKAITAGSVRNWYDIPYTNFEKPWYNKITNDAATFNGKLFNATCSLGISAMQYTYAMFANSRVCDMFGWPVEELYELVYNNEWVYDKFNEIVSLIHSDLNGDGKKDEDDLYGYESGSTHSFDVWLTAFDQKISGKNEEGEITIDLMTEKTIAALQKIYDLTYNNPSTYYFNAEYREFTKFAESKVGICPAPFRVAYSELREMKDSYAILPYPKWDENQKMYLTNIYDQYSAFSIPKTVYEDDHLEFAGIIVEALNAESYKKVYPAFYDIALKNKYTEDEDSARMVDIIMEGANMDFSYMFGETNMQRIPYLFRDCINNKTIDIASEYAKKQKSLSVSIKKLYTFYEDE